MSKQSNLDIKEMVARYTEQARQRLLKIETNRQETESRAEALYAGISKVVKCSKGLIELSPMRESCGGESHLFEFHVRASFVINNRKETARMLAEAERKTEVCRCKSLLNDVGRFNYDKALREEEELCAYVHPVACKITFGLFDEGWKYFVSVEKPYHKVLADIQSEIGEDKRFESVDAIMEVVCKVAGYAAGVEEFEATRPVPTQPTFLERLGKKFRG